MKQVLKYVLVVLAFVVCFTWQPSKVEAADIKAATQIGTSGVTWRISGEGVLYFEGTGTITTKYTSATSVPWYRYMNKITRCEIAEGVDMTNMDYWFCGVRQFTTSSDWYYYGLTEAVDLPDSVVSLTSMQYTYSHCEGLEYAGPGSVKDTVTNMQATFDSCFLLTSIPEIPEGAINISSICYGLRNLKKIPSIPKSVTQMELAFCNTASVETAPVIPSNVTNASRTFIMMNALKGDMLLLANCPSANTFSAESVAGAQLRINYGGSCTREVAQTYVDQANNPNVVLGSQFSLIPGTEFYWNVSSDSTRLVIGGQGTFNPNYSENNRPVWYQYKDTVTEVCILPGGNITNMNYWFDGFSALKSINYVPDTVTSMASTFRGCSVLTGDIEIPAKVDDMSNAFNGCAAMSGNVTLFNNPESFAGVFLGCATNNGSNLVVDSEGTCKKNTYADVLNTASDDSHVSAGEFKSGVPGSRIYWGVDENGILQLVGGGTLGKKYLVDGKPLWFDEASKIKGCSVESGISVTNMDYFFLDCVNLEEMPEIPNTVSSINGVFEGCTNLSGAVTLSVVYSAYANAFKNCAMAEGSSVTINAVAPVTEDLLNAIVATKTEGSNVNKGILLAQWGKSNIYWGIGGENADELLITGTGARATTSTSASAYPWYNKAFKKVTIDGSISGNFTNAFSSYAKIEEVSIKGIDGLSLKSMFNGCANLKKVTITDADTTDASNAFYGCTKLVDIKLTGFTAPKMSYIFYNCKSLVNAPELPEGATDLNSAFSGCTSLVTAPEIPSGVTDMGYAFKGCSSLTSAPAIPEGVTDLESTFNGCSLLEVAPAIPISVTNMSATFSGCKKLTTAPEIPSGIADLSSTFSGCTSLVTAPVIPEGVTGLYRTFYECSSLVDVPVIPEGVTDLESTFSFCKKLAVAPDIPDSVTNLIDTFHGCSSIANTVVIPEGVTDLTNTFYGCASLTSAPVIPKGVTDLTRTFAVCTKITNVPAIPSSVTNLNSTFQNCTGLVECDIVVPRGATTVTSMFSGCTNLSGSIKMACDEVNTCTGTFTNCATKSTKPLVISRIETCPEDIFNAIVATKSTTSNAVIGPVYHAIGSTDTFWGVTESGVLTIDGNGTIDFLCMSDGEPLWVEYVDQITGLSIDSGVVVKNMDYWFKGCANLVQMPEIPETVTSMNLTFKDCTALTGGGRIPAGVVSMDSVFNGCTNFTGDLYIDAENVVSMDAAFSNCSSTEDGKVLVLHLNENVSDDIINTIKEAVEAGNNIISWAITDDGTLTIFGEGDVSNQFLKDGKVDWSDRVSEIKTVELSDKLTITDMSHWFEGCANLTSFPEIPSTVTKLDSAFKGCSSLSGTITVLGNPTSYESAFLDCATNDGAQITINSKGECTSEKLAEMAASAGENESVKAGAQLHQIEGTNFFWGVTPDGILALEGEGDLGKSYLVNGKPVWADYAESIKGVSIDSNTTITCMDHWFEGCTALEVAPTIPETVVSANSAFKGCTSLVTAPTIPSSVTSMNGTFAGCESLVAMPVIPEGVISIKNAFEGCGNLTTVTTIPESVTEISNAFKDCTSMTVAPALPNGVEDITGVFSGCTSLVQAPEIPSSVTNMTSAFEGCTTLGTAPTIPSGVTNIDKVFSGCTSLTGTVTVLGSIESCDGWLSGSGNSVSVDFGANCSEDIVNDLVTAAGGSCEVGENLNASIPPVIESLVCDSEEAANTTTISFTMSTVNTLAGYAVCSENSSENATWISTTSTTATVDISANGVYYVFCKDNFGNVSESKSVSVSNLKVLVTNVTMSSSMAVTLGDEVVLQSESDGEPKEVVYESADTNILTVDTNGKFGYPGATGVVRVTVTYKNYDGSSVSASCDVSVTDEFGYSYVVGKNQIGESGVYWGITEDGKLVISGSGDPQIDSSSIPWESVKGDFSSVVFTPNVTPSNIDNWFKGCTELTDVAPIPSTVVSANNAFEDCTALVQPPVFSGNLQNMNGCFSGCTSLESAATIPNTVVDMGGCYDGCSNLSGEVFIPDTVEVVSGMLNGAGTSGTGITLTYSESDSAAEKAMEAAGTATGGSVSVENKVVITEPESMDLVSGSQLKFEVEKNTSNSEIIVESSDTDVATVTIVDGVITVIPGTKPGPVTITVTSPGNGLFEEVTKTYDIVVTLLDIGITAKDVEVVYDGLEHGIVVDADVDGAKVSYSEDAEVFTDACPKYTVAGTYVIYYKAEKLGYNTVSGKVNLKINKADGKLNLSDKKLELYVGESGISKITDISVTPMVKVDNNSIVDAVIKDGVINITAKAVGSTKVTVTVPETDNTKAVSCIIDVTVKKKTINPVPPTEPVPPVDPVDPVDPVEPEEPVTIDLSGCSIQSVGNQFYSGGPITPKVSISYGGTTLTEGVDYVLSYSNNVNVGTASVVATGTGKFSGTISTTFSIVKTAGTLSGTSKYTKTLGNKPFYLKTKLSVKGKISYKSSDKKVVTVNSKGKVTIKGVGKATITVTGAETAMSKKVTKKITITVRPKGVPIREVAVRPGNVIAVYWGRNSKASGYQLQYSTDFKFSKAKTITLKSNKRVDTHLSKVKSDRRYYVRVRSYKTVKNKRYYSSWSKEESCWVEK